jgi:hypothetical protein
MAHLRSINLMIPHTQTAITGVLLFFALAKPPPSLRRTAVRLFRDHLPLGLVSAVESEGGPTVSLSVAPLS